MVCLSLCLSKIPTRYEHVGEGNETQHTAKPEELEGQTACSMPWAFRDRADLLDPILRPEVARGLQMTKYHSYRS